MKFLRAFPILVGFWLCTTVSAQTEYVLTEFPIAAMGLDTVVTVRWTGEARLHIGVVPDSGAIYFSKIPGGKSLENRHKVVVTDDALRPFDNQLITGAHQRQISFRPKNQPKMGPGKFYYVVAWPVRDTTGTLVDTFFSNELQLIVETDQPTQLLAPSDTIPDLTPTFSWKVNPGVPYYHLILSDEKIGIDSASGEYAVEGLSIVWQAITANTQIVYGAPDPSGTLTADPPPMSPGQTYSVVVLNNYGNHPAYTSTKFGLPKTFTIAGDTLKRPINVSPIGETLTDSTITFKWTNLDKEKANTYKVYVYISSPYEEIDAQMVAWQNEVTAGTFKDVDTAWMTIDARKVLTKNHYTWKVIACDDRGAGSAGDTTSFDYASPTGRMKVTTVEEIPTSNTTIQKAVAAVEIKVDVVDGSMEKPLLFYTGNDGVLSRDRPVGTYRITASKEGFEQLTRTVTVKENQTTTESLILRRPDATVFGSIVDQAGVGIDLATVTAVSELGDTVFAETDRYGSFVVSCYAADWLVWGRKNGFITGTPREVTVQYGESYNYGPDTLERVPFTVSGEIQNPDGDPLIGANVKILRDGAVIGEVPSTSQDGDFSFSVEAGEYTLRATKTGFSTASKAIQVAESQSYTLPMAPGAAMVNGYVIGRTWVNGDTVRAPIPGAEIYFALLSDGGAHIDTMSTTTDATYGSYSISLPGGESFEYWSKASGYAADTEISSLTTDPGVTITRDDLLKGFATISGSVTLIEKASNTVVGPATGVTITLLQGAEVKAVVKSSGLGDFEIRGVADGTYSVNAGKDGLALHSVTPGQTLTVTDGMPSPREFAIEMITGDRRVKWKTLDGDGDNIAASVKVQSPLRKTISSTDSLQNAGSGTYVVIVDAKADSVIDCSYHRFTVDTALADSIHIDTVVLPITFIAPDTLTFDNDSITIVLSSKSTLDSAAVYYRLATATTFKKKLLTYDSTEYRFRLLPGGDGRDLVYYFEGYRGTDVYGYSGESFRSYIEPSTKVSKLSIRPGSGGGLLVLPADYETKFTLSSFYSSAYFPKSDLDSTAVSWSIDNEQVAYLENDHGLTVTVRTGATGTGQDTVRLFAAVESQLVRPDVDTFTVVKFTISDSTLDSIVVRRTDAGNPNPINTSPGSKAEFAATGFDSKGTKLSISPSWSVLPEGAGTIDGNGVFTPSKSFSGYARIIADAGEITAEYRYNVSNPQQSGILVRHLITRSSSPDTLDTRDGCAIMFPPNVVGEGESALFEVSVPILTNPLELKGDSSYLMIGDAFDIEEVNGVNFTVSSGDSIRLTLNVPEGYGERAASKDANFVIGYWNPDSLIWTLLRNSVVSVNDSDTLVTAAVSHFSRYAVMIGPKREKQGLEITPNPFSPFAPPITIDPSRKGGTRISFELNQSVEEVKIRIYNVVGDLVWAVYSQTLGQGKHSIWWNGRTTEGEMPMSDWIANGENAGKRMCRNGRYFVILTIRKDRNTRSREMKPVILMK